MLTRKRLERDELLGSLAKDDPPFLDDGRISIASINSERASALLPAGADSHVEIAPGSPATSAPATPAGPAGQTIALTPARFRDLYRGEHQGMVSPP